MVERRASGLEASSGDGEASVFTASLRASVARMEPTGRCECRAR